MSDQLAQQSGQWSVARIKSPGHWAQITGHYRLPSRRTRPVRRALAISSSVSGMGNGTAGALAWAARIVFARAPTRCAALARNAAACLASATWLHSC